MNEQPLRHAALVKPHPLTIHRRRAEAERVARITAWCTGFIVGVLTAMAMLVGVTFVYCATALGGHC